MRKIVPYHLQEIKIMNMQEQMNRAEESILHTYNRFQVVFERGEGVYLYDTEGRKYLDFAAGIAVNSLGYHYPGYDEALKDQIDRLTHISNLYYSVPLAEAGRKEPCVFYQQRYRSYRRRDKGSPEICLSEDRPRRI